MPRRLLTRTEIEEARLVFGSGLDYTRACVYEGASWTNWIDQLGAWIQRRQRGMNEHNAITLGFTSYFPISLHTETVASGELRDMTWLIHELTHQWQFQHMGWKYLFKALGVQLREGRGAYNYQREHKSREDALHSAHTVGLKLNQFNLEQQGDIARDYYYAFKHGADCSPWDPFVEELRAA